MALPSFDQFVDRGSYWYHKSTGSTANPVVSFTPSPSCVILDEDIVQYEYIRGRHGVNANYSEDCVRKTAVTYSASATVLSSAIGLPIVSQLGIEDIISLNGMQQIGANSYRHCQTGSTLTYSSGCDFTVDPTPCGQTGEYCSRTPIGVIGVSIQRVTAFLTPAGACIKVPVETVSMSMRARKSELTTGGFTIAQLRDFMALTGDEAEGPGHAIIQSLLHDSNLWSFYNTLMTGVISTCS